MSDLVGVDDHLARCLALVAPLPASDVPLLEALDGVLVGDVVATSPLPAFVNSSMDGYAVHVEDVAGAGTASAVTLPVVGDLPAGVRETVPLSRGTAVRIMTGAPVPDGTSAVVPVEWTDAGTERVVVTQAPDAGQHLRRVGEDVRPGALLLADRTRLGPRQLALLAAVGRGRVSVRPRPRVAVLSTGSELVAPGREPGFGQVSDANGTTLTAAALDAGAVAHQVGVVGDDADLLLATLTDALAQADVLVTSGGVSAGAYDTVKEVFSRLGSVRFDRVAMQPGMPQGVGTLGGTPVFTLPGNPVSAYVSFEVFVRPALRLMLGEPELQRTSVTAVVGQAWRSPPGKRQFVRVALSLTDDGGAPTARPLGGHGSHLVADLAHADALAVVPEDVTAVEPGDELTCLPLERGRR